MNPRSISEVRTIARNLLTAIGVGLTAFAALSALFLLVIR